MSCSGSISKSMGGKTCVGALPVILVVVTPQMWS